VQTGRPLESYGAHCLGYNHYVGVCLIGIDEFTTEQFNSLETLIRGFTVDSDKVIGHNKVSPKTCPNFSVEAFKLAREL
jgi:N-acetyl-anhydromuramyl-L-alanine amidase AmpD